MPILTAQITSAGPIMDCVVHVSGPRYDALEKAGLPVPPGVRVRALLDTGASGCCVDPDVISQLALPLIGFIDVLTPSTGTAPVQCRQYDASLWLLGPVEASPLKIIVPVVATPLSHQGFDVLVGRDVLNDCLMVYHGPEKIVTLTL